MPYTQLASQHTCRLMVRRVSSVLLIGKIVGEMMHCMCTILAAESLTFVPG